MAEEILDSALQCSPFGSIHNSLVINFNEEFFHYGVFFTIFIYVTGVFSLSFARSFLMVFGHIYSPR